MDRAGCLSQPIWPRCRRASGRVSIQTIIASCILLVAVLTAVWLALPRHADTQEAGRLFEEAQYLAALDTCEQILRWDADNAEALAIAGLAAAKLHMPERALEFLRKLPQRLENLFVYDGLIQRASLLADEGRISEAISDLQQLHSTAPDDVLVTRRLGQLLSGIGDTQYAVPVLLELVEAGHASADELMILAGGGSDLWSLERIRSLRERTPDDRRLILAELQHMKIRGRHNALLQLIDATLSEDSPDSEMYSLRLQLTGITGEEGLKQISNTRPTPVVLGLVSAALNDTDPRLALECAIRRVEMTSHDPIAHRRLAEQLRASGADSDAASHQEQATLLNEMAEVCRRRDVFGQPQAQRVVEILRRLGRANEAVAWCRQETRISPDSKWPKKQLKILNQESGTASLPIIAAGAQQARTTSLQSMTTKDVLLLGVDQIRDMHRSAFDPQSIGEGVAFQDVAAEVGLNSQYYNGTSADRGRYMHEFTGGGVGVLDLDGDDWPDLMLSQGSDSPMESSVVNSVPDDQLFRNLRGQSFVDVGKQAGITEFDFGQGVAIGDVNLDGFDDIYVANIGTNALWINQGDGTFVRQTLADHEPQWTISAAILDMNGDSIPDLYDVNYVTGANVFAQLCDHDGQQRICSPTDFEAAADELWIGNGDGTFRPASAEVGLDQYSGNGMGIVAGDLWRTGTWQAFVTNDEMANFVLEANDTGLLRDSAVMRGVAFGRDGEAQGSMGIAAGRANSDDQLDLFVTNYYGELNCLHIQSPGGFFDDATRTSQLEHPGRPMLGFGTQFLDVDTDGDDDLFVANGHLDDFTHMSIPYQMRAQLFMNHDGHFVETPTYSSPYLDQKTLGRAVAKLDWNRDGRTDLCVTHLDRPVALLENRSDSELAVLQLQVTLISGLRDGTGCVLTVTPAGDDGNESMPSVHIPLLSGDGYACSNQRAVTVAIPDSATKMRISGPDIDVVVPVRGRSVDCVSLVEGSDEFHYMQP